MRRPRVIAKTIQRRTPWLWVLPCMVLTLVACQPKPPSEDPYILAAANGERARQANLRAHKYLDAWLAQRNRRSGLLPRSIHGMPESNRWSVADCAADNFPYLVLTAFFLDQDRYENDLLPMLEAERRLCGRDGSVIPESFCFSGYSICEVRPNAGRVIFEASEYARDGLLTIVEWMGRPHGLADDRPHGQPHGQPNAQPNSQPPDPWRDRLVEIVDATWEGANIATDFGHVVSLDREVNGELLQVLNRLYWLTGQDKYLEWSIRLGDLYLLAEFHPSRHERQVRLRDHGGEIVAGLAELYATLAHVRPRKLDSYRDPMHDLLDDILDQGRNEYGMFYDEFDTQDDDHSTQIVDTWGYLLSAYSMVHGVDGTRRYRKAEQKLLKNLPRYVAHRWETPSRWAPADPEMGTADGYADAIESALMFVDRADSPEFVAWIDSEIDRMWSVQKDDGMVEGWYGDGNFARTTLMYAQWKSMGVIARPWRQDLAVGAVQRDDWLYLSVSADSTWEGTLYFDAPRHRTTMSMPEDWLRINRRPEWFTVDPDSMYGVWDADLGHLMLGHKLIAGIPMSAGKDGREVRRAVRKNRLVPAHNDR